VRRNSAAWRAEEVLRQLVRERTVILAGVVIIKTRAIKMWRQMRIDAAKNNVISRDNAL
jgi:hypothetical protein